MSLVDDARTSSTLDPDRARPADHSSFTAAYPELYAAAFDTVYRYSSNRNQAADLAQEAMVRAFTRWRTLHADPNRQAWVCRTAINLAISAWRKRETAERFRHLFGRGTNAHDHQEQSDASIALRAAVSELPKRQRDAIALRFYADLPERAVAEAMGCTVGTVRDHLGRAIERLRTEFLVLPELAERTPCTATPGFAGATAAQTVARARSVRRKTVAATLACLLIVFGGLGVFRTGAVPINPNEANDRKSTTTTTTTTTTPPAPAPEAELGPAPGGTEPGVPGAPGQPGLAPARPAGNAGTGTGAGALTPGPAANAPSSPTQSGTSWNVFGSDVGNPPDGYDPNENPRIELGMRFTTTAPGAVHGIRVYRASPDVAPRNGSLWDANGNRVASVTFPKSTSTGWTQGTISTPVRLVPGQTYTVSYYVTNGHYSANSFVFTQPSANGPLRTPADAGVFTYGPSAYPFQTYQSASYFVDVVFVAD